jgi:hypothetical protein
LVEFIDSVTSIGAHNVPKLAAANGLRTNHRLRKNRSGCARDPN